MSAILHTVRHPTLVDRSELAGSLRTAGVAAGLAGLALVGVTLIANLAVATDGDPGRAETLAWTFGLTTTGLVALKAGIALTLIGILLRIRDRIVAVQESLPALAPAATTSPVSAADASTAFGPAARTVAPPAPLRRRSSVSWPRA